MKKIINIILCSTLIFSSTTLIACEKRDKLSTQNKEKIEKLNLTNAKEDTVELQLFFDASKNSKKPEIAIEERLIKSNELLGEVIILEIIKGPTVNSNLKPILPRETRLISFSINEKIAYVNLSKEAITKMSSSKEEASLRSIIWSLTTIPSIEKVKILVDNNDAITLGGNYDISKPLGRGDIESAKLK
ncbi:GerMN domain-containing protein [Clostridium malenominatum]|uniref:GerMN domain-containing protein n=1 Tax=Clostridium malenominatum TaxID=1539 RepID=A0ABP3U7P2_9CLOT